MSYPPRAGVKSVTYPTLDQLDTETRVLLALERLDRKDPLFSTLGEVAKEVGLSKTTTIKHLHALRNRVFVNGVLSRRWGFRCTEGGRKRAQAIRLMKPRQRLIFATIRRLGEGHYKGVAEASGLDANGVSQSLSSANLRTVLRPVYNTGNGWVYAA